MQSVQPGGMITAFIMVIVVTVCVRDKAVSWWDDYNFWATDVKSLFYLNGFADKYTQSDNRSDNIVKTLWKVHSAAEAVYCSYHVYRNTVAVFQQYKKYKYGF